MAKRKFLATHVTTPLEPLEDPASMDDQELTWGVNCDTTVSKESVM